MDDERLCFDVIGILFSIFLDVANINGVSRTWCLRIFDGSLVEPLSVLFKHRSQSFQLREYSDSSSSIQLCRLQQPHIRFFVLVHKSITHVILGVFVSYKFVLAAITFYVAL